MFLAAPSPPLSPFVPSAAHTGPTRVGSRGRGSWGQVPAPWWARGINKGWAFGLEGEAPGTGLGARPACPRPVSPAAPPPPQVPERRLCSDLSEMGKTWSGPSATPPVTWDGLATPRVTPWCLHGRFVPGGGHTESPRAPPPAWASQARSPRAAAAAAAARPGPRSAVEEPPEEPRARAPRPPDMVGHLHLQGMEESLKEPRREGLLDSPDSGLPPSPSPSPPFYSLAPGILDARSGAAGASSDTPQPSEARAPPPLAPNTPAREMRPRMLPVFFGEGIAVNPEPTHEIRCNSEVKYASEKHFRDNVFYAPVPTVTAYSETIVAAPNCTWRNYRSQLTLEPRPRALHFRSTTIIFPKHARSTFRTTLQCSLGRPSRRFTSSVQLQLCQQPGPRRLAPAAL